MKKEEKSCRACQSSVIERLTPIDDECDGPLIFGIDYQLKCVLHDIIIDRNHFCDDFELPF